MKLYHFTSQLHLPGCMQVGLCLGLVPTFIAQDIIGITGTKGQWLTSNPSFDQSWQRKSSLPYHRNDFRLKIHIPKSRRKDLYKWEDYLYELTDPTMADILSSKGDPENWYLFHGVIKPSWIRDAVPNPAIKKKPMKEAIEFMQSLKKQYPDVFKGRVRYQWPIEEEISL